MFKLLIFLLFPLLELYCLVALGGVIGGFNVILLVVGSFIFGAWVLRTQTQTGLEHMRSELGSGRVPENFMWDNLLIYLAGVLLMIPGVISDIFGILLLIPPMRKLCYAQLGKYLQKKAAQGNFSSRGGFFVFTNTSHHGHGTSRPDQEENGVFECTAEEIKPENTEIIFDCTSSQDSKPRDGQNSVEGKPLDNQPNDGSKPQ